MEYPGSHGDRGNPLCPLRGKYFHFIGSGAFFAYRDGLAFGDFSGNINLCYMERRLITSLGFKSIDTERQRNRALTQDIAVDFPGKGIVGFYVLLSSAMFLV
jgi:hypothetical protein